MPRTIQKFLILIGVLLGSLAGPASASAESFTWDVVSVNGIEFFADVSCPTESLCVAVDGGGGIVTSTNPTGGEGVWDIVNLSGEHVALTGISCPTKDLCVAVGFAGIAGGSGSGSAWVSTNPTGGEGAWTAAHLDAPPFSAIDPADVSCPSVSLCVAARSAARLVWTSTSPTSGEAWPTTHLGGIGSGEISRGDVSCPTEDLCVAVDHLGDVWTSTNPTGGEGAWTAARLYEPGVLEGLRGVSCPSTSLCVAAAGSGRIWTSTNPTGGKGVWSAAHVVPDTGYLWGVSCPSTSLCVATHGNSVSTSTDPTGGAGAWTLAGLSGVGNLRGISCPTESLCVATDWENHIAVGVPGNGGEEGSGGRGPGPESERRNFESTEGEGEESNPACTLEGGPASDTLTGTPGNDVICGYGGDDILIGGAGSDELIGGSGSDALNGGSGPDRLFGGPDEDRLTGGPGSDHLGGGPDGDILDGKADGVDTFVGGGGGDLILAQQGRETVKCGGNQDLAMTDKQDKTVGCRPFDPIPPEGAAKKNRKGGERKASASDWLRRSKRLIGGPTASLSGSPKSPWNDALKKQKKLCKYKERFCIFTFGARIGTRNMLIRLGQMHLKEASSVMLQARCFKYLWIDRHTSLSVASDFRELVSIYLNRGKPVAFKSALRLAARKTVQGALWVFSIYGYARTWLYHGTTNPCGLWDQHVRAAGAYFDTLTRWHDLKKPRRRNFIKKHGFGSMMWIRGVVAYENVPKRFDRCHWQIYHTMPSRYGGPEVRSFNAVYRTKGGCP